jgi:hypothetical protein
VQQESQTQLQDQDGTDELASLFRKCFIQINLVLTKRFVVEKAGRIMQVLAQESNLAKKRKKQVPVEWQMSLEDFNAKKKQEEELAALRIEKVPDNVNMSLDSDDLAALAALRDDRFVL